MRTNTLLLTVALGVASAATSMAQVYSVNSVGYINIPIKTGFNLVANQLVQANQTIDSLLAGSPDQLVVYKFIPGVGPGTGFDIILNDLSGEGGWVGDSDSLLGATTFENGGGLFIFNPGAEYTITLVGEVKQGALSTPVQQGFQIVSSQVPQMGAIGTDLGLPSTDQDTVYKFVNTGNPATSAYVIYLNDISGEGSWVTADGAIEPVINVGEAVFLLSNGAHAAWNRTFTVN